MTTVIRYATTLRDAMGMRRVRNECRELMTRDPRHIPPWRQIWWWWNLPDSVKPIVVDEKGNVVGYGLVVVRPPFGYVSGALLPSHRQQGLGTMLFGRLAAIAERHDVIPALEVFVRNEPARRTYARLGFVETRRYDGIIEMERPCQQ